jgi:hypothetical protein
LLDRTVGFHSRQPRTRIRRHIDRADAVDFFNLLTGPDAGSRSLLPASGQCLGGTTRGRGLKRTEHPHGSVLPSPRTPAVEMTVALTRETGRLLCAWAQRQWRWRGRCMKLADGTGISMPDRAESQARYPQPRSQAQGVGFPLAGLVGIVCLSTGRQRHAADADGAHAVDLFHAAAVQPVGAGGRGCSVRPGVDAALCRHRTGIRAEALVPVALRVDVPHLRGSRPVA